MPVLVLFWTLVTGNPKPVLFARTAEARRCVGYGIYPVVPQAMAAAMSCFDAKRPAEVMSRVEIERGVYH